MFSIPGVLALIVVQYVRPQVFIPQLAGVPLVHLTFLATIIGLAIDLRLRILRPRITPLVVLGGIYLAWCLFTLTIHNPSALPHALLVVFLISTLFFFVSESVQSFRAFRAVANTLVTIGLFLAIIGIQQGLAPRHCIIRDTGISDKRPCNEGNDCFIEGEPGKNYMCEHEGWFDVHSVAGRVRWLGIVEDPNELAMCVSICIPLLISMFLIQGGALRGTLFLAIAVLIITCNVYTQSRGGQLVFISATGVYFVKRYGIRGVIVGAVIAAPLLSLGGRSGDEAAASALERTEALLVATKLMLGSPLVGVGYTQFTEHHFITAHNSYALAGAEIGFPGLYLFISMFYFTMKSFLTATKRYASDGPARVAHHWGTSLMAAQSGLMLGIFFLSFNTSAILWTFFGICNAYYLSVSKHDPTWKVVLRPRDFIYIGVITTVLASVMIGYTRFKLGGHH